MLIDTQRRELPEPGDDITDTRSDRAAAASRAASPLLDRLTDINLDDLFDAAGLMCLRRTSLQRLLRPAARRFALVAQEFDKLVGEQGLARGSSWLAHRMAAGTQVSGRLRSTAPSCAHCRTWPGTSRRNDNAATIVPVAADH